MSLIAPENWRPHSVDDLEPRAWEALREVRQSVCVTAGAGAGKTEFLAQKGAYLLETGLCAYPKRVLAISFKRDAARNLADRIAARCPEGQARRFVSMTFDAFTKHLADQFRDTIAEDYRPPASYSVSLASKDQLSDFLRRHSYTGIRYSDLEREIAKCSLPTVDQDIPDYWKSVLNTYWKDQYEYNDTTYLTFAMINRLVDLMLRRNPRIRSAIQATYPFVFLDEFQDTTHSQFGLMGTAFQGSSTIFTAVGDDKQRIMGWAGALDGVFDAFTRRYNARCISLLSNWRSHTDLVEIQHVIASRINPAVERPVARRRRQVAGSVAAIWVFADQRAEAAWLSNWIADEIAEGGTKPEDLAILVRMSVNDVEEELGVAFAERGIKLRNLARLVGSIAIQDLLAEELTKFLMPFLRLGATRRNASAWVAAQKTLQVLEVADSQDEVAQQRIVKRVEDIASLVRGRMQRHAPDAAEALALSSLLLEQIGERLIRRATPSYKRDLDFKRVREGFMLLLQECATVGGTWNRVLDQFEGIGQVPLMTVHKSKGLEFHTMIFFGLDSRSWRSLQPEATEELKTFFVAFTRAEQRAFFTCCHGRGDRITWLENLLGNLVPRIVME